MNCLECGGQVIPLIGFNTCTVCGLIVDDEPVLSQHTDLFTNDNGSIYEATQPMERHDERGFIKNKKLLPDQHNTEVDKIMGHLANVFQFSAEVKRESVNLLHKYREFLRSVHRQYYVAVHCAIAFYDVCVSRGLNVFVSDIWKNMLAHKPEVIIEKYAESQVLTFARHLNSVRPIASKFVNERTANLINYYCEKFHCRGDELETAKKLYVLMKRNNSSAGKPKVTAGTCFYIASHICGSRHSAKEIMRGEEVTGIALVNRRNTFAKRIGIPSKANFDLKTRMFQSALNQMKKT